ncbi:hypothetical protein AB1F57_07960 [Streptococcus sp. ZY1909104]
MSFKFLQAKPYVESKPVSKETDAKEQAELLSDMYQEILRIKWMY